MAASSQKMPLKSRITDTDVANEFREIPERLKKLLEIEKRLIEIAATEIISTPALIRYDDIDLFKRGTINIIQGRMGSHKSRAAETIAALMLSSKETKSDFWGMTKAPLERFSAVYIDTERSMTEEFPKVIQRVRQISGIQPTANLDNFFAVSIKSFSRDERKPAVEEFIKECRRRARSNHLIVFLDVLTDCVKNFNNEAESLELFDFLGNLCEKNNATVIGVLHENPGTEKARGHTGTEAGNKASTVLQISIDQTTEGNDTALVKVKFIKIRHDRKPMPILLEYCPLTRSLISATPETIKGSSGDKNKREEQFLEALESVLGDGQPLNRQDLLNQLGKILNKGTRQIETYIKEIIDAETPPVIHDNNGVWCKLAKTGGNGKLVSYHLEPEKPEFDTIN